MKLSRRTLLMSASAGAALTTVAPGLKVARAAPGDNNRIMVVLFLRGGADGLNLVSPANNGAYQDARPTLAVDPAEGLEIANGVGGETFFINPGAPELHQLYTDGDLGIVHSTGVISDNRSHFVSMDMMERGFTDAEDTQITGWLTRHLTALGEDRPLLSTVSKSSSVPVSLLQYPQAVSLPNVNDFNIWGGDTNLDVIRQLNTGTSAYANVATQTVDAIQSVQAQADQFEQSDEAGVQYPGGSLSGSLQSLAQLIKMDVGLDIATVDYGGWDTHNNQANEFATQVGQLSQSLNAFWQDLDGYHDQVTLIAMTEFGRRLGENGSQGTDHGNGSVMLALGAGVAGGQMHGEWPGLTPDALNQGDLASANDYRMVLADMLVQRFGQTSIEEVFPTITYSPMGLFLQEPVAVATAATGTAG